VQEQEIAAVMAKPSYTELPYHKDRLPDRKALFDYCDSHANHYLSLAEVDKALFEKYTYGDKSVDDVKKCMLEAFDAAKNYGGDQKGAAADFVEHREFRIFLEIFVKKLDGVADHKPEPQLEDQTAKWMHRGSDTLGACSASLDATVEHDTESDGFHSSTWTPGSAKTGSCSVARSSSSHSCASSCAQADQVSDDLVGQNHSLGVSPGGPFQRSHGLVLLLRHEFLKYAFLGNLDFQAWFVLRRLSPAAAATLPCDLVEEVARHTPWALTSRQMHANLLRGANDANQLFIYLMRMGSSAPFKGCFQELFDAVKGRRWTLGSRMIADHSNVGPFSWPDQEVADHSTTTVSRLDQEAQRCIVSAPKEAKRCMNLRDLLLWLFELLWYKLVFDFAAGWLNQVAGMLLLPPIRRLCS